MRGATSTATAGAAAYHIDWHIVGRTSVREPTALEKKTGASNSPVTRSVQKAFVCFDSRSLAGIDCFRIMHTRARECERTLRLCFSKILPVQRKETPRWCAACSP